MGNVPNIFALGQAAYKDAYDTQGQIAKDRTKIAAGRQLAGGDYTGAAATLNSNGQIDDAHNVLADQQVMQDRSAASDSRAQAEKATEAQRRAEGLLRVVDAVQSVPVGSRLARLQQLTGVMQGLGIDPKSLGAASEADLSDDHLASFRALAGKAAQDYTIGNVRYAGGTNKPIAGFAEFDPHKTIYAAGDAPPAAPGGPTTSTAGDPVPPPPAPPASSGDPQMVWNSIKQQESGGQKSPGTAVGPDTRYGNALGSTQMLPQTAQTMATKLGVPFRPDLLQSNAPEGLAYQDKLGQAYFQEGLQKYGGDLHKAAMYYYGGPDERLWGPKTHAYAQQVLARADQSGAGTLQGGAGGDVAQPQEAPSQIPGFHLVSQAKPEWQDMADGRQRNVITGKVEGSADNDEKPLSPEAVALVGAQYLRMGPDALKNMGQGKAGVGNKSAVMEWVAKTAKEAGTSNPELVGRFAQNKANLAALTQNTKMLTQISASTHTLDKNLEYAMSFANKGVGPTGVPLLDTPINKLREQLGSADAKDLDNLLTTTGNEYAKILSSATGTGGATSDSARAEAQRLIHSGMTLRQLTDAVKIAKQEADNRKASYVGENRRLNSEISGLPDTAPPVPAPAATPRNRPPLAAIFK